MSSEFRIPHEAIETAEELFIECEHDCIDHNGAKVLREEHIVVYFKHIFQECSNEGHADNEEIADLIWEKNFGKDWKDKKETGITAEDLFKILHPVNTDITQQDVHDLMLIVDINHDGDLNQEEFIQLLVAIENFH